MNTQEFLPNCLGDCHLKQGIIYPVKPEVFLNAFKGKYYKDVCEYNREYRNRKSTYLNNRSNPE